MAMDDGAYVAAANNTKLGLSRAFAIVALAARALENSELLDAACTAISDDRAIGFHVGMPAGWLGADKIFSSGQETTQNPQTARNNLETSLAKLFEINRLRQPNMSGFVVYP
jgi:hypothetical protein